MNLSDLAGISLGRGVTGSKGGEGIGAGRVQGMSGGGGSRSEKRPSEGPGKTAVRELEEEEKENWKAIERELELGAHLLNMMGVVCFGSDEKEERGGEEEGRGEEKSSRERGRRRRRRREERKSKRKER